jgi:hypothetical protein
MVVSFTSTIYVQYRQPELSGTIRFNARPIIAVRRGLFYRIASLPR